MIVKFRLKLQYGSITRLSVSFKVTVQLEVISSTETVSVGILKTLWWVKQLCAPVSWSINIFLSSASLISHLFNVCLLERNAAILLQSQTHPHCSYPSRLPRVQAPVLGTTTPRQNNKSTEISYGQKNVGSLKSWIVQNRFSAFIYNIQLPLALETKDNCFYLQEPAFHSICHHSCTSLLWCSVVRKEVLDHRLTLGPSLCHALSCTS